MGCGLGCGYAATARFTTAMCNTTINIPLKPYFKDIYSVIYVCDIKQY